MALYFSPLSLLDPGVARAVRWQAFHAWRSLRYYGFERQDIHQEFYLRLTERHGAYHPRRSSPETFSNHVCRHRGRQLVERAVAAKRGGGSVPSSLANHVQTGDLGQGTSSLELVDTISEDGVAILAGRQSRPAAELLALRLDVNRVVGRLPGDLAEFADLLAEGETVASVARRLRISRATAYRRMTRLRAAFSEAGLEAYLFAKGEA